MLSEWHVQRWPQSDTHKSPQRKLSKCQRVGETNKNRGVVEQWMGFPGGSDAKESLCNAGDPGSGPASGRSPGEGHGSPLQYSCLENSMDRGAWWATVPGVTKGTTEGLTHTNNGMWCTNASGQTAITCHMDDSHSVWFHVYTWNLIESFRILVTFAGDDWKGTQRAYGFLETRFFLIRILVL